jgi:hypothetical protein
MKKTIFNVSALSAVLFPALAFAQSVNTNYFDSIIGHGLIYLRTAVTVLMILMTVFFLYNVLRFIMNTEPAKAGDLRKTMINGLIGLFVSVAVWGIISLAGQVTGVDTRLGAPSVTCPPGTTYVNGLCTGGGILQ